MMLTGMFHWGHLVGNYGVLEGQEQCLQSRLWLVVTSSLVMEGGQNIKRA